MKNIMIKNQDTNLSIPSQFVSTREKFPNFLLKSSKLLKVT